MATTDVDISTVVGEIIRKYPGRDQDLMAVLQDVQNEFSYLPKEALLKVRDEMGIPLGQIYSVATFYNAFSLEPKGKYPVCVCTGTACHVKGAPRLIEAFERELGISMGETTEDCMFSLEEVRCVGCCGLAPAITIGTDLHGKMKVAKVKKLVRKYRSQEESK
jgi:NADH:ubiquinone oxidoreductase subunit E